MSPSVIQFPVEASRIPDPIVSLGDDGVLNLTRANISELRADITR